MTNKNFAILTLPLHNNFGGNIQAYALANYLKSLGLNVRVINIKKAPLSKFDLFKLNLKPFIKKYLFGRDANFIFTDNEIEYINQKHRSFIEENMNLTEPVYSLEVLKKIVANDSYDGVVVGSDQVWRKAYTPNIESYFLDFITDDLKIKKIAYAASFGVDHWEFDESQTKRLKELAARFDFISVREDSGVELFKRVLGFDVKHFIDPTLLLTKSDYLQLIRSTHSSNTGKLFYYILDESDYKSKAIIDLGYKLGKSCFGLENYKKKKSSIFINNLNEFVVPSVQDWLKSFYDADCVITDSFHGMVFSIIFNKPFFVFVNKQRGATRFYSLLRQLNLQNRILDHGALPVDCLDLNIDYNEVNRKINSIRDEIRATLIKVINS